MATASSSSSSSSSCAAVPRWDYDVFLSFRGEDTRAGFVSHLHPALRHVGLRVFIDDELRWGETISLSLERAIECSRIAIVVYSPNFPASTWCLQELTKIVEMKDSRGQLVRPVFLRVDPSDVRKQTGVFAEIMARHEDACCGCDGDGLERVKKWRDALYEAANLSGWHLSNGLESELIQKIVEEVSSKLHRPYLDAAKHPVALDKHIQAVRMLLRTEDDGIHVVGICGIGGIEDDFEVSVVGTVGYLDPEYFLTRRLTPKSDVYGYGIVLLELLSGRKALDRDVDGSMRCIGDTVVPRIVQGEIGQALDPKMPIPAPFEMMAVADIAYLAVDCAETKPENRPLMTCVVDRLRSALAQLSSEDRRRSAFAQFSFAQFSSEL